MFEINVNCPACGRLVDVGTVQWVQLDRRYCSSQCAEDNFPIVDTALDCPVCAERSIETGKTGMRRCGAGHVWQNLDGEAVYVRRLNQDGVHDLRLDGRSS